MAVIPEIDISPNSTHGSEVRQQQLDEQDAKKRWRVLSITFFSVLFIGLAFVWLRSPVYQSAALLQFVYPDVSSEEQDSMAQQDFAVSESRLTSPAIFSAITSSLEEKNLYVAPEDLMFMLSTHVDSQQRLIELYVSDTEKENVTPVMQVWLDLFLAKYKNQKDSTSIKNKALAEEKIEQLEIRIAEQRAALEAFSTAHDIDSLENDENRVLSKMQSITQALNEAEQLQTEASSELAAIKQARLTGQPLVNEESRTSMKALSGEARQIEQELDTLRDRYTDVYMRREPAIVQKMERLKVIEKELAALTENNDVDYEAEINQQLISARARANELSEQRDALQEETQSFRTRLSQYQSMTTDVEQLETQAQRQKERLLNVSISRSFEPRVDIIEPPVAPIYPIGPNYWVDSAIALAAAIVSALIALMTFKMVGVKRTPVAPAGASFTVIQPPQGNSAPQNLAAPTENEYLTHQADSQPVGALSQPSASTLNLGFSGINLSDQDSLAIVQHAVDDGKLAILLSYSGVAPDELVNLTFGHIDLDSQVIHIESRHQRSLKVAPSLYQILLARKQVETNNRSSEALEKQSLWLQPDGEILTLEDISMLIQHAAQDARLAHPESIDLACIRHSYLAYLAQQGLRLNLLEQVAGYVSPKQLSQYRGLAPTNNAELSDIDLLHPILLKL